MNALVPLWLLVLCGQITGPLPGPAGTIRGRVLNGSQHGAVVACAEVVLRVQIDKQFVAVAETTTDEQGMFHFDDVPVVPEAIYLPGANHGDVHYPGPRVRLLPDQPTVDVEVTVFDSETNRNPLVIRRHEIVVRPEPGLLKVTESLQVENPTLVCFGGGSEGPDDSLTEIPPVTLRLGIPGEFQRATFQSEFLGRRFSWNDDALVTRIPWPPGTRHVEFSYTIANDRGQLDWKRTVDLPCDQIQLTVYSEVPEQVRCEALTTRQVDRQRVVFASARRFEPGSSIDLQLNQLPLPWSNHLRGIAVGALVISIAVSSIGLLRRRDGGEGHQES